jgi:hypothetical protein
MREGSFLILRMQISPPCHVLQNRTDEIRVLEAEVCPP